ncbi:MAG: FxsA family protein [Pseudomonadales bacterium]|nr:FxsA family protein [Pseudomonadales bacterium]
MVILIEVGGMIGPLATVGLVVLTAVTGVWLLRLEGTATLFRVQEKLNRGEIPETELLEGIMLLFGGALLLTPGFATDAAGFICLLPGLRRPIARHIISTTTFSQFNMHTRFQQRDQSGGFTIDGEYEQENGDPPPKRTIHGPE